MDFPLNSPDFQIGEKVEVCIKEDGFVGSYYEATILQYLDNGHYMVRYKNLLEEDMSRPLIETIHLKEIRPLPPHVHITEFRLNKRVDVFENDGWWIGKITRRRGSHYHIYFITINEEKVYNFSRIRLHHEWANGEWYSYNLITSFT